MIILSLFFLGAGVALIMNTVMAPAFFTQEISRDGMTMPRSRRFWPMAIGAIIASGGVVLVVLSRVGTP